MKFTSTFKLDKRFLRELRQRLIKDEQEPFGFKLESKLKNFKKSKFIPSLKHLEDIISKSFWASTKFEEGRSLLFRVNYSPPMDVEHVAMSFNMLGLRPWNTEEIRKLAPAVVPPNGQICVYPDFFPRDELQIYGLQTDSFIGTIFEILDPARIIIRTQWNRALAEITGGESGFISSAWRQSSLEFLTTLEVGSEHAFTQVSLENLYQNFTTEILARIRLLRHGGTLIFVNSETKWQKSVEKPISYCTDRHFNGIRHIEESLRLKAESMISDSKSQVENVEGLKLLNKFLKSPQILSFIADAARTVAYLTAVDGATVLSKHFDVLAFGVKIKELQKVRKLQTVTSVFPLEDDESISGEASLEDVFRGKRHLSAARFVSANPDTMAIVVSQDGGITGFAVQEECLIAYRSLELIL